MLFQNKLLQRTPVVCARSERAPTGNRGNESEVREGIKTSLSDKVEKA